MKRVYIDPQHRGQQLGEKLLAALEAKARQRDCHTLRLETGIHQHAAITLYTRNGYQTRCAFARISPIRSACLWRNRCLPIFVQQRYKRLQLAGFGAPAPHQPGGEPAPLFGQRPGGTC
jgi:RimJ/RimL family protein N-acetyltransferase